MRLSLRHTTDINNLQAGQLLGNVLHSKLLRQAVVILFLNFTKEYVFVHGQVWINFKNIKDMLEFGGGCIGHWLQGKITEAVFTMEMAKLRLRKFHQLFPNGDAAIRHDHKASGS